MSNIDEAPARATVSPIPSGSAAMMKAAEAEWRAHASEDWTTIDFRGWPRGFHRSAWVVAGYIGWNPLDVLDAPTPAARAVNVLLTRLCVAFIVIMARHTPDPGDPVEQLLARFNATVDDHKHDIANAIERFGDIGWDLPTSRRRAARRLVKMWERDGAAGFVTCRPPLADTPLAGHQGS
jgi:hypothetical protein